jgi:hypothetical protein
MGRHDGVDLGGTDGTYPKEIMTATKGNSGEPHRTWIFKRQTENSRTGGTLRCPIEAYTGGTPMALIGIARSRA